MLFLMLKLLILFDIILNKITIILAYIKKKQ